eukprot:Selendium_serpulae@DN6466_c1_g2_i2.p2
MGKSFSAKDLRNRFKNLTREEAEEIVDEFDGDVNLCIDEVIRRQCREFRKSRPSVRQKAVSSMDSHRGSFGDDGRFDVMPRDAPWEHGYEEAEMPHLPSRFSPRSGEGQMVEAVEHNGFKRALLIGINYGGTDFELKGCIHDTKRMSNMLIDVYDFVNSPKTMVTLT